MHVKNPTAPCICCYTTLWNINVNKQATNDKLQGSVAAYLRCDGAVNNQIKKNLLLSLSVKSYKQKGCRVAQLVKCLVTSGYPDGSSSGGPGSNPGEKENFWKIPRITWDATTLA